jgi:hypothetical protein
MSMSRLRVVGVPDIQREGIAPDLGALSDLGATANNVQAAYTDARRELAEPRVFDGLAPDTIIELTVDGGVRFWLRYDQLTADLPMGYSRSAGDPDTIDLPLTLDSARTRGGLGASSIEAIRTFDVDLGDILGGVAGAFAGPELARRFDKWLVEKPGVWLWTPRPNAGGGLSASSPPHLSGDDPILLFIHGTASTTEGSFGGLHEPSASASDAWREALWTSMLRAYGDRIVAFEHRTLGESPIENTLQLLKSLPANARLHIVSHSRGGMIGELLCRAQRTDGKLPLAGELDQLKRWVEKKKTSYRDELAKLVILDCLLSEKRPRVERFVRVACPAAGTTLASGRLDRWLSAFVNMLDLTGLGASVTYRCIKGFLIAAVKTRTDPRAIPGLEAMMPGSLLTILLNRPEIETTADLSVIAGHTQGDSLLGRLALKLADWFYGGNHDLVVDTFAMYGGIARTGRARAFFDEGSAVNHFRYFRNRNTVERLFAALRNNVDDLAGFAPLERPAEIEQTIYGRREGVSRPKVLVVPALLGSNLAIDREQVWADPVAVSRGRFVELSLGRERVQVTSLHADTYSDLIEFLSGSHEVFPFPYDWRRSLLEEGERFGDALDAMLGAAEPVRIIAHSTGGLLVLAAFALRPQLRRRFVEQPGCRLLMLGTPYRGSPAICRLLLGEDRLVPELALLDLGHEEAELVTILASFPGIIEHLPVGGQLNLFSLAEWIRIKRERDGLGLVAPTLNSAILDAARKTRRMLDGVPVLAEQMFYVAGKASVTPVGLEYGGERGVRFFASPRGDGRAPWDISIPPGLTPWWVELEHGELACASLAFPAYLDLIENGSTSRLPRELPPADAASLPIELPAEQPPIFPHRLELIAAALGFHRKPALSPPTRIRIRLVHGNLAFARWAVALGHYKGDTLVGSERHLDRTLDLRLTKRLELQLYPSEIGTSEIVLDKTTSPPGAIIIGLGQVGILTPGNLRRSIAVALRRYGVAVRETALADHRRGISIVLIGASEGGVGIRDSVYAILEATLEANAALGADRFGELEIVELYEDRAIQAAHIISSAVREGRFAAHFIYDGWVQRGEGGRRRAAVEADPDWWRWRQITAEEDGALRFVDLTDRARADVSLVPDQRAIVDRFVRNAVARPVLGGRGDDPGATLFELLLPNPLKEEARSDRNMVLMLDQDTAQYPWELLHEGTRGDTEPPAVRAGLIRQLAQEPSAARPPIVTIGNKALLIGDPPSGIPELPPLYEAKAEAESIAGLLERDGFSPTSLIRSNPESIIQALMAERWRILHLAGHGVVDFVGSEGRPTTGMVLGEGLFLTPQLIYQMRDPPELVFVNCCHLGAVRPEAERLAAFSRFHELAANLGTAFISRGARAVVAAGWAVHDAAARLFAETLYGSLVEGLTFGMAVLAARKRVYEAYPQTNTWGAYQCYGDRSYRLVQTRIDGAFHGNGLPYVALREAVFAIEAVTQDAQTMAVRDPDELNRRFDNAVGQLRDAWKNEPEVLYSAGEACAELSRLDEAIAYYEKALACEKAAVPVRTIEQLANLRARRAATRRYPDAKVIIQGAIATLRKLQELTGDRPTSERLGLLGSCHKRLAQVTKDGERTRALEEMGEYYRRAHEALDHFDPYPCLNWQLALQLGALRDVSASGAIDLDMWLRRAEAAALPADETEPSFWNAITSADVKLMRLLALDISAIPVEAEWQNEVVEAYLQPWRRGASSLKFASVLEHLEFVAEVLTDGAEQGVSRRYTLSIATRSIAERLRTISRVDATGEANRQPRHP